MTDQSVPRIAPLLPPDWDAAAYDVMAILPHGRDNILASWRDGKPLLGTNLVCTQLRHAPLAKAFLTFNAHFFYASKLTPRVREILIMRIGWLRHSEYEYLAHVIIGRRVGLTQQDIERIQIGPMAAGLSPDDAVLLRAVDELKADARLSDATYTGLLAQQFDAEQLLELVFLVGCYDILAMTINSFGVQLDNPQAGLDEATRARLLQT